MARWKLLPESWLYGLADVRSVANTWPSYIFGKVYAHGMWFYFPVAFVIKATLTTLIFLPLSLCHRHWEAAGLARDPVPLSATVALLLHLYDFEAEHRRASYPAGLHLLTRAGRRGRVETDLQGSALGVANWRPHLFHVNFVIASVPNFLHRLCQ